MTPNQPQRVQDGKPVILTQVKDDVDPPVKWERAAILILTVLLTLILTPWYVKYFVWVLSH